MCLKVDKVASPHVSGCVCIYLTESIREINCLDNLFIFSYGLSFTARSKRYLDPSPSQKVLPDIMVWPNILSGPWSDSWFPIYRISTLEIRHIMFNEPKVLQTIVGSPQWKMEKCQVHYGLLNFCHDKWAISQYNFDYWGDSSSKMWTFIQTTQ